MNPGKLIEGAAAPAGESAGRLAQPAALSLPRSTTCPGCLGRVLVSRVSRISL